MAAQGIQPGSRLFEAGAASIGGTRGFTDAQR